MGTEIATVSEHFLLDLSFVEVYHRLASRFTSSPISESNQLGTNPTRTGIAYSGYLDWSLIFARLV